MFADWAHYSNVFHMSAVATQETCGMSEVWQQVFPGQTGLDEFPWIRLLLICMWI